MSPGHKMGITCSCWKKKQKNYHLKLQSLINTKYFKQFFNFLISCNKLGQFYSNLSSSLEKKFLRLSSAKRSSFFKFKFLFAALSCRRAEQTGVT